LPQTSKEGKTAAVLKPQAGENSRRALRMVTEKALIEFILIGERRTHP